MSVVWEKVFGGLRNDRITKHDISAALHIPAAEIDKVSAALRKALADEGVRSRLMSQGAEPASSTPAELAALLKKDGDKWGRVVKAKNIKPD